MPEPERKLICAVIEQAVLDSRVKPEIFKTKELRDKARVEKDEAIAWLLSKSKTFMGFEWYCHLLNLPAGKIREKIIKEMKQEEEVNGYHRKSI